MNRKELVDELATKTGCSKADAERGLSAMLDIISDTLKTGESLSLVGFGTFEVRSRAARTGRNPQTGETIQIDARRVPTFTAGTELRDRVNRTGA